MVAIIRMYLGKKYTEIISLSAPNVFFNSINNNKKIWINEA